MATEPKKGNLGRGLSALLGEDPSPAASEENIAAEGGLAKFVPVESLVPGKYQPRRTFEEPEIEELAASVRELGILQPILVRTTPGAPEEYEIIAGERRWRAAQRAQIHQVPIIEKDLTDSEALEIALVENLQRENLSPLDEAEGYQRLIEEFTHTQEDLAKVLGKSRSHVANMLRLLNLPDPVKDYLNSGKLTAGHARALLSASDPIAAAHKVVKGGLNVRQTEKLAKGPAPTNSPRPKEPAKDVDTLALERDLSNLLGLKVDILFRGQGGSLTVHYESLEQLDDILHRLRQGEAAGSQSMAASAGAGLLADDVDTAIAQLEEGAAIDDGEPHDDDVKLDGDFSLSDNDIESLLSDD